MRAAIYCRKSTKQDDSASVSRQEEGARQFIADRGWTVADVYTDDGKSGAVFLGRPEFQRMLKDAASGAFDVVVLFDLDRFGRNAQKTMAALNTLADCGVDIYDFSNGQQVDLESFGGEVTTHVRALVAQQFREDIRKHTKAAMRRKAEKGLHTHGKVFGYNLNRISKGHCELRINEQEADIVRDIYTRFAAGQGARTIAAALNRAGTPKPRAQQGRRDGWSVSTIRAVLRRPLYKGEIVYGRTAKAYNRELRKVYRHTTREKGQLRMPEATWIRVPAEHLRIIDPDLAARVDSRLQNRKERYLAAVANGNNHPHKAHGKYLLSGGMLLCPNCGGHFEARKNPWRESEPGGHPRRVYICSTRRRKPGVCSNTLALPIAEADDAVLSTIEGAMLDRQWLNELLAMVDNAPDETTQWLTERNRLQMENDRLTHAIAAGVPPETVAALMTQNQGEIRRLDTRLRTPRPTPLPQAKLREALEQRAAQWKSDLRAEPQIARLVLRQLVGPLTLWDESERPDFVKWEATPKVDILDGLAPTLEGASPRGIEERRHWHPATFVVGVAASLWCSVHNPLGLVWCQKRLCCHSCDPSTGKPSLRASRNARRSSRIATSGAGTGCTSAARPHSRAAMPGRAFAPPMYCSLEVSI